MLGAASTLSTTDIQSIAPGVHSNPPTAFPSTVALAMTGAVWSVTDIVARFLPDFLPNPSPKMKRLCRPVAGWPANY